MIAYNPHHNMALAMFGYNYNKPAAKWYSQRSHLSFLLHHWLIESIAFPLKNLHLLKMLHLKFRNPIRHNLQLHWCTNGIGISMCSMLWHSSSE